MQTIPVVLMRKHDNLITAEEKNMEKKCRQAAKVVFHNKLVRDKVPEIIRKNGEIPITHIASEKEFRHALFEKLLEEATELIASKTPEQMLEEIADIYEVLKTIASVCGFGTVQVEEARLQKKINVGGFKERIILDEVKASPEA